MGVDWKEYRLGDLTDWYSGGTPSKKKEAYWNGDIPWISASSMYGSRYSDSELKITEEGLKSSSRLVPEDTVLLLVRGSALHQRIPVGISLRPVSFNQDVKAIRIKDDVLKDDLLDPWFLLYWFFSQQYALLQMVENTGIGAGKLDTKLLQDLSIKVPPKKERKLFVAIAKSIDDKIELNRQINQTLEQIAQAIFKSWFVDFEPVKAKIEAKQNGRDPERAAMCAISGKTVEELDYLPTDQLEQLAATAALFPDELLDSELGLIPKRWEVVPFSRIAKLDTTSLKPHNEPEKLWEHYSIPAFDESESPVYELGAEIKSNKYKVQTSAILASKLNPHFSRTWWPAVENEGVAICSTEFMQFVPHDSAHRSYVYGLIVSKPFQDGVLQRVTGTTGSRQRAQPKSVAEMNVVSPGENLIAAYCSTCQCMLMQKAANIKENKTLTHLRDTFLPKLLSGEITVSEIQGKMGEVV